MSYANKHIILLRRIAFCVLLVYGIQNIGKAHDYENLCDRLEKANQEYKAGEYDKAKNSLGDIELGFAELGMWNDWYSCIFKHYRLGGKTNYVDALKVFQNNKGNSSKCYLESEAKYYELYALVLRKVGRISECIPFAKRAYNRYSKLKIEKSKLRTLTSLAVYYANLNDHESAIKYSLELLNQLDDSSIDRKILALTNLSYYYYHSGEQEEALHSISQAIGLQTKNNKSNLLLKAKILNSLNRHQDANKLILELDHNFLSKPESQSILADIKEDRGLLDESKIIRQTLVNNLRTNDSGDRTFAKELEQLAKVYYKLGDFKKALNCAQEVIIYFCEGFQDLNHLSIPSKDQLIPEAFLMEALFLKAKILTQNKTDRQDQIIFRHYDLSFEVLDLLRKQFAETKSKYTMTNTMYDMFSSAINFTLENYQKTKDTYYLNKAFEYSQISKAFTLKEAITEREAFVKVGVKENLINEFLDFKARSNYEQEDYFLFKDSLEKLKRSIYQKHPMIVDYLNPSTLSLSKAQELIKDNQLLLHYFLDENNMHCIAILKNKTRLYTEKIDSNFTNHVSNYYNILKDPYNEKSTSESFFESAKIIFDKVISKAIADISGEGINHLIFIPDGIVHQVSFSNLPLYDKNSWTDPASSVLSEYATSYLHFSDELKIFNTKENTINQSVCIGLDYLKKKNLAVAQNVHKPNFRTSTIELDLAPIAFAKKEAQNIGKKLNSTILLNEKASINKVKIELSRNDLIHYAGHCIIDQEDYTNSFIPIYKEDGQYYKLDFSNIQALNIQPKLVVLSACNTNNGKSIKTEGKFSMSRVFTNAGAKSVLGSNWNTPDGIGYKISSLFYNKLLEGHDMAQALRLAQLDFLTNDEMSAPSERKAAFWSNWALHGNTNALEFNTSKFGTSNSIIFSISLICILGVLVAIRLFK